MNYGEKTFVSISYSYIFLFIAWPTCHARQKSCRTRRTHTVINYARQNKYRTRGRIITKICWFNTFLNLLIWIWIIIISFEVLNFQFIRKWSNYIIQYNVSLRWNQHESTIHIYTHVWMHRTYLRYIEVRFVYELRIFLSSGGLTAITLCQARQHLYEANYEIDKILRYLLWKAYEILVRRTTTKIGLVRKSTIHHRMFAIVIRRGLAYSTL